MAEGFDCVGVDIAREILREYPSDMILADLSTFRPRGLFDVIVASPPCTEFSVVKRTWRPRGMKADFQKGMRLVEATFEIIRELKPEVWIFENVCCNELALELLPREPVLKFSHSKRGWRWLWSNIDLPLLFDYKDKRDLANRIRDPWKRAEIPFPVARAVAKAVRQELN